MWSRVSTSCARSSAPTKPPRRCSPPVVILTRGCEEIRHPEAATRDEGSQNATAVHFEILRRLRAAQDDGDFFRMTRALKAALLAADVAPAALRLSRRGTLPP